MKDKVSQATYVECMREDSTGVEGLNRRDRARKVWQKETKPVAEDE